MTTLHPYAPVRRLPLPAARPHLKRGYRLIRHAALQRHAERSDRPAHLTRWLWLRRLLTPDAQTLFEQRQRRQALQAEYDRTARTLLAGSPLTFLPDPLLRSLGRQDGQA